MQLFWQKERVLITGIAGFTGRHLAASLESAGSIIHGLDRYAYTDHGAAAHTGSLLDVDGMAQVVESVAPGVIFHLAGLLTSDDPAQFERVNTFGTEVLLRAVAHSGSRPRTLLVSSSAVYGAEGGDHVSEETRPDPITPYGRSKLAMEQIAGEYIAGHRIPIVICRPFNLVGPGLRQGLALSSFAAQIARAERGEVSEIHVGNLDAGRDYLDVRDAVAAYRLLAEHGETGEIYNVCSGNLVTIRDCLEILLSLAEVRPRIRRDAARSRHADNPSQVGDPAKIRARTGWQPHIPLEQSLGDLLDDWRSRVDAGG